jgi:hypothetical protein
VVEAAGKTVRPDAVRSVSIPSPVRVEEDAVGRPAAVSTPRRQTVADIADRWRLDDEWWRADPISRMYYVVVLAGGQRLVLYKDLVKGDWYRQNKGKAKSEK